MTDAATTNNAALEPATTSVVNNDEANKAPPASRRCNATRLLLGLALIGFVVFVIADTLTNQYLKDAIESFLEWIEENPGGGAVLFIVVYMVATVIFIPGSLLTLGAGFVFASAFGLGAGVVLGTLVVFVGASLGALLAFCLGRYLLRDQALRLTRKYAFFEALDAALAANGLKIFVLLRLSPIIPFNVINYVGGVSSVSLRAYALALVAILPGTLWYVFLGASAGSLTESASSGDSATVTIVVVVTGAIFGIGAIWATTKYARQELNRILEARRNEEGATNDEATNDDTTEDVEAPREVAPASSLDTPKDETEPLEIVAM